VGMVLLLVLSTSTVFGFELGRFDGTTIKACFIGGGDYEKIYEKFIPEFEELTGAKVEIVYKGNGFDIDKKMKIDLPLVLLTMTFAGIIPASFHNTWISWNL